MKKVLQKFGGHTSKTVHAVADFLDWAWKINPKWSLICHILPIGSRVMERSSSMSADLYSDLTIGLGMKNYPKMTPHMPHSAHWFQSYGKVFFHVSWFVQWPHQWIGHEKLPQNDPSYARIHPLVPKLWIILPKWLLTVSWFVHSLQNGVVTNSVPITIIYMRKKCIFP